MNYFEFYEIPVSFLADEKIIKQRYYLNSKNYHPDFFINESPEKQASVLQLSTVNNEAYRLFTNFDKRVEYVLTLTGQISATEKHVLWEGLLVAGICHRSWHELAPHSAAPHELAPHPDERAPRSHPDERAPRSNHAIFAGNSSFLQSKERCRRSDPHSFLPFPPRYLKFTILLSLLRLGLWCFCLGTLL